MKTEEVKTTLVLIADGFVTTTSARRITVSFNTPKGEYIVKEILFRFHIILN